jgi:hypothetical protein
MAMADELVSPTPPTAELSAVLVPLLKGVSATAKTTRRTGTRCCELQARVRDYVAVLALDLTLDEAEGYAFLRAQTRRTTTRARPSCPAWCARQPL